MAKTSTWGKALSIALVLAMVVSLNVPFMAYADEDANASQESTQQAEATTAENESAIDDEEVTDGERASGAEAGNEAEEADVDAAAVATQSDDAATPAVQDASAMVAEVGGAQYESIAEAINAITGEGTVKLVANTTEDVTIPTGKTITLDLNGKTLTTGVAGPAEKGGTWSTVYGELIVKDSSTSGAGIINELNSIQVNGGKFTLENGAIVNVTANDYGVYALNGGTVTVNGGSIRSDSAPLSGNNTTGSMNFYINGGQLTAKYGPAIYMPGQCSLAITGGVLNGGISLRMGQVEISGGTINAATSNIDDPAEYYSYSGNAWLPDAIYVFGGTYDIGDSQHGNSLNISITGGSINCSNSQGSAVAIYDLGKVAQSANVSISGSATLTTNASSRGAYEVLSLSDIGVSSPTADYGTYSGKVSTSLTGGTYSSNPDAAYICDGYTSIPFNGAYKVEKVAAGDATGSVVVPSSSLDPELSADSKAALAAVAEEAAADLKSGKLPDGISITENDDFNAVIDSADDDSSISVKLVVSLQPSAESDSAIESAKKSDESVAQWLDLSVDMVVTVTDASGKTETATAEVVELGKGVTVSFGVDPELIENKNVRIARNHEGAVNFIDPKSVDYETGEIVFTTDKFSSYALLTSEKTNEVDPGTDPDDGSNGNGGQNGTDNGNGSTSNVNNVNNTINNNADNAASTAKTTSAKTGDNLALVGGAMALLAVAAAAAAAFALRRKMN